MIGDELKPEYRIGLGRDIRALVADRPMKLGGIVIACEAGLQGPTDGDVILCALVDALLGAAGLGDLEALAAARGGLTDQTDCRDLLLDVKTLLDHHRWQIVNLDVTVWAEQPRLEAYRGQMRRAVAGLLEMDFAAVSIKTKTHAGVGSVGRGEAVSAEAIVLLRENKRRPARLT